MDTSSRSRLNDFKNNTLKLDNSLNKEVSSQQDIIKRMWEEMDDDDWNNCRKSWADLDDSTKNIYKIIEQHKKSTSDILSLLENVIEKLENMEALSIYRDFISEFFEEVEASLDAGVWAKARAAINKKLRMKKVDYKQDEKEYISKLESFLQENNMTVEDVELMMQFKKKSNAEFHQGERLGPKEVKEKFETSFPEDLKDFKDSMRKVLDFLYD